VSMCIEIVNTIFQHDLNAPYTLC